MNDNTCSICLEPLLGADGKKVGTTVPCGHCFHTECFSMWMAAKGRKCKCPNCNVQSKKFVNLFLSVGDANIVDEEDDLSLSSIEQDEDDEPLLDNENDNEDEQQPNNDDAQNQQDERDNSSRGTESQSQETIGLDDIRNERNGQPPSGNTNSQETITIDDDDNDEEENDTTQPQSRDNNSYNPTENEDDDSVQVVDLTMSPVPSPPTARQATLETSISTTTARPPASRSASSSHQNNNTAVEDGDQTERFKKIAKKYKRKFLQKQSQCQEQYKQHQDLAARMKDIQNSVDEKNGKLEDLQKQSHYYQLEISNLQLVDVRRGDELRAKTRQVAKLTSHVQRATSELTKLKANYERDLSQAHSNSTAEVKDLAARTKELQQENARLRALNQQREGRRDDFMVDTSNKKKKSAKNPPKDVAKALRGMDAVRTIPGSTKRKSNEVDTSRYSAQAARFVLAGQKKRKGPLSVAAADMLRPKRPNHETSLTLTKSRRPLQRINSHDSHTTSTTTTTMTQKKGPPKMASIFQRR